MKQLNHITKFGMLCSFTAITALCIATSVRAESSNASNRSSHGGGGSGGTFYPTASTVSQLIADINYANKTGGAITINLAPAATFDLSSAASTDNGFPVIGGTTAVDLTITGNGDTIERIQVVRKGVILNFFRLFEVAAGSSLTLNHVTLQGGYPYSGTGGAILNEGTLNLINGSVIYSNSGRIGGGIYNNAGTVTVNSSSITGNGTDGNGAGIFNNSGTVTINNSSLSGNHTGAGGDVTTTCGGGLYTMRGTIEINNSTLSNNSAESGGAVYNDGGIVSISNRSLFASNTAFFFSYDGRGGRGGAIYDNAGTVTIDDSLLTNNVADEVGGGIDIEGGTVTINNSSVSGNSVTGNNFTGYVSGGGIYNNGTAIVENLSSITGNTADDVQNSGTFYLQSGITIPAFDGNSPIPF